jgi:hypothetical protein
MEIFKNIFGGSFKKVKSIPDLFTIDIVNIDFDNLFKGGYETFHSQFKRYKKNIYPKECELFDFLEVSDFNYGFHILIFSGRINNDNMPSIGRLVNKLFLVLGKDRYGKGTFNNSDKSRILLNEVSHYEIRYWEEPTRVSLYLEKTCYEFQTLYLSIN